MDFKAKANDMRNHCLTEPLKVTRSSGLCSIFASAFITLTLALPMPSAGAKPVVAKLKTDAPVTVTDNGYFWTLDNGIVKATINKNSGAMTSLLYHGINTMGGGGYWEETPEDAPQLTDSVTIDPAANGGERAEVAIKGVTGGTVMLTPNAPGGGTYLQYRGPLRAGPGRERDLRLRNIFSSDQLPRDGRRARAVTSPNSITSSIGFRWMPTATCSNAHRRIGARASSSTPRSSAS